MTAFRNILSRIGEFLDVVRAAASAASAVRSHRVPAAADLRVLGINGDRDAIAALARA